MAINFQKLEWFDRESENPTRRKLTPVGTENSALYTVERADTVQDPGTPFNASSMNSLEVRISQISSDIVTSGSPGGRDSEDKIKLDGIEAGATKNTISSGTDAPSGGNNGDIYLRFE
jgi:hypothetical protein